MYTLISIVVLFVHLVKLVEETGSEKLEGSFCGRLANAQTYVTESKSATLFVNPTSESDHFNAYYDVLSPAAFQKRYSKIAALKNGLQYVPGSVCDVALHNCHSGCQISSPHYPNSYPRNRTCHYHVTFDRASWQVVLGGQSADRYDLSYDPDCKFDRVAVYENVANQHHQVAKFCGRGSFPQVN